MQFVHLQFRDCALIIRRGVAVKQEGGKCKLTGLGRGVTCKFLGKVGGGASEKTGFTIQIAGFHMTSQKFKLQNY